MNWIWEDQISSITIDRHIPCIVSYCKVDESSVDHLSEYLHELRKALSRFPSIYPGLKIVLKYEYDSNISSKPSFSPLLNELAHIISSFDTRKVGLVNQGSVDSELPIEALFWRQRQAVLARHFDNEVKAKAWLRMDTGALL